MPAVAIDSDVTAQKSGDSFRPDVEGLRGVAILLVVGSHCGISWCAGGFVGVDVFLVLSGYLITALLVSEYRATSRIDLTRFFARRARRLVPANTLALLVVMLAAAAIYAPQEIDLTARAARAAGLYASNVFFDRSASDYFSPNVEGNPLLHTWSLGLEEQFYLLWPLLILLVSRRPNSARRTIWILSTVAVVSFICGLYAARWAPTFGFYELPGRAWEFAAGGLLAMLPVSKASTGGVKAMTCGVMGITTILGTAVLLRGGTDFPGWIALFPVAGTLATLGAGASAPRRGISAALGAAPLQFVGARSYSWYLWHWPVVVFAGVLFPDISVAGKVAAAIAALLVATLTYSLVERPVRENRYLNARPGLSLGIATVATLLSVVASWVLMTCGLHRLALDKRFQAIGAANIDIADISPKDCWSEGRAFDVKVCEFGAAGAAGAAQALVLFGDSHAIQWVNPMRTAAIAQGWHLVTVLRPGCAASDINPHRLSSAADQCEQWRARAIEKIIALHPSAVVMASYNGATIRSDPVTDPLMSTDEIRRGTRRTLEMLSRAGVPIVVLRDTPLPPFNIAACVGRRVVTGASCDFDPSIALNDAAFAAERAAADGLTNAYVLDMNDVICAASLCPATQHDLLIYRDENHLTGTFAATLAPTLRTRLYQLLSGAQSTNRSRPSHR